MTIAIISIITLVVIINYGSFNSTVLLKSQAYELALNLREAQVYSISARGEGGGFRDAYGLYFATGSPNVYRLFLDVNSNGRYDANDSIVQNYTLDSRFSIAELHIGTNCSSSVGSLSVSFQRPDFDAHIYYGSSSQIAACIVIESNTNTNSTRSIYVSTTGQIEVR